MIDSTLPPLPPVPTTRAVELVQSFAKASVVIVGDVMLDQFLVGRVNRISPEAPVPVVEFTREEHRCGGAANVAHNARALGAGVELVGVIGRDAAGERLLDEFRTHGLGVAGLLTDMTRRTTTKVRIVTERNQQVARVDYETDSEVTGDMESALASQVEARAADARVIVVSDYLKGVVTRGLMARVVAFARRKQIPVLVDPKIPHIDYYAGATLITPNHHEAEMATHKRIRSPQDARTAAVTFRRYAKCDSVLITLGEQGMWLSDGTIEGHLTATAREVSDVTGAGDTVIATLALALAAGGTVAEAARLANEAAGIVVGKFGPATVSREELLALM